MGKVAKWLFPALVAERDRLIVRRHELDQEACRYQSLYYASQDKLGQLEDELATARTELAAKDHEIENVLLPQCRAAEGALSIFQKHYDSVADQLISKTLECASLQAKLTALQPAPLEPEIVRASTAADVRRLVEQANLREQAKQEQETA